MPTQRPIAAGAVPSGKHVDKMRQEFEQLGLSGPEARVLTALLYCGTGSAGTIAAAADIPRPNVYPVLDTLVAKGVADVLAGKVAKWTTPGPARVLERLCDIQRERLSDCERRAEQMGELLAKVLPGDDGAPRPYVHLLADAAQVKRTYDELLAKSEFELLMFTRPPYAVPLGRPNPAVIEALARRVVMRVLYPKSQVEDPEADAWRAEMAAYHDAGVEGRVVDELPIKLSIFDRKTVLVAMSDVSGHESGYPAFLLVEHHGYAAVQVTAFEQYWARSRRYPLRRGRHPRLASDGVPA